MDIDTDKDIDTYTEKYMNIDIILRECQFYNFERKL